MKKFIFSSITILFLMVIGSVTAGEVLVGSITPLTGRLAVYGHGFQQAMLVAVDEVNASGGIKGDTLTIVFEDNHSTSKGSVSAMRQLTAIDRLPLIFGPAASSNFLAVCPMAQENKTILLGAESAAAAITKCGSYVFRVFPSDLLQSIGVAELANSLGYSEVVLTYINNDWGIGLAEAFKTEFLTSGGKIIDELAHGERRTDYRTEIFRMKRHNPEAIVNLSYIKEGAVILKQGYEAGLNVQWLMGSASRSEKLVKLAGEASEGVIGTYPAFSRETPQYKGFKTGWEKKYPEKAPPIFGEYNYDMVKMTALALNSASSYNADDIKAALIKVSQGYIGATGDKSFDKNGDVGVSYSRWTVKDGSITDYME